MLIEGKAQKKIANGSTMTTFTLEGKQYNTFEESWANFNIGDHVKITTETKGKYTNINSMEPSTAEDTANEVVEAPVAPQAPSAPNVASVNTVMNTTDKPHSYEFGKAGNRHKVYYREVDELKDHIAALIAADLYLNNEELEVKPQNFHAETTGAAP